MNFPELNHILFIIEDKTFASLLILSPVKDRDLTNGIPIRVVGANYAGLISTCSGYTGIQLSFKRTFVFSLLKCVLGGSYDITTEAFPAPYKVLTSRRGVPIKIPCDSHSNFVGVSG